MPSTTVYRRGDVVLVEIAFTGSMGSKRRPAVVISSNLFNNAGIKLVVAAITGNLTPPQRLGDVLLKDWIEAGLMKASAVRGIIATVDKSEVIRTLGQLSTSDFIALDQALSTILNLSAISEGS